jgi:hypothetical protein
MSEEHEDGHSFKHPVVAYAFAIVEYLKNTNPELYKRAVEYAEDLTGVELEGFELEEVGGEDISENNHEITDEDMTDGWFGDTDETE